MENRERTIERVRKLMAMADDASSPNEAVIAARRARSLMDKHGLRLEDLEEGTGFGESIADKASRKMPCWKQYLAVAVANWNDSIVRRTMKGLVFMGEESDALVATAIYGYLVATIERLAKEYVAKNRDSGIHGKSLGNSFKLGASDEICKRIREIIKQREQDFGDSTTGTALVVVKKDLVEKHFGPAKYSHNKRKDTHAGAKAGAYQIGKKKGAEVSLNTQLNGKAKSQARIS